MFTVGGPACLRGFARTPAAVGRLRWTVSTRGRPLFGCGWLFGSTGRVKLSLCLAARSHAQAPPSMRLGLRVDLAPCPVHVSWSAQVAFDARSRSTALGEDLQAVFLDDRQELSQWGAGPLGARFPLVDRAFARVEVAGEHALADIVGFAELLNFGGRYSLGTKCRASKTSMVVLSIAPTL
jgi:hypothetical protein